MAHREAVLFLVKWTSFSRTRGFTERSRPSLPVRVCPARGLPVADVCTPRWTRGAKRARVDVRPPQLYAGDPGPFCRRTPPRGDVLSRPRKTPPREDVSSRPAGPHHAGTCCHGPVGSSQTSLTLDDLGGFEPWGCAFCRLIPQLWFVWRFSHA